MPYNFKTIIGGVLALVALLGAFSTLYVVDEGHVGIVKRFSKAVGQVDPGLHMKIPFVDDVVEVEVRTRKNEESLSAGTSEQMQFTAKVSANWTVNKASALQLFIDYGSLDQFESRVLDPKLRSATKAGLSKFTAEEIIKDRNKVIAAMELELRNETNTLPIQLSDIQLENVAFPQTYSESIEKKQTAKNLKDAEQFNLDKQALVAQQAVNTANAERDATKARADGDLYAALKEAEGKRALVSAVDGASNLVKLEEIKRWNGSRILVGSSVPVTDVNKLVPEVTAK